MNVWVVTGKSESGDDCGPLVFSSQPSQSKLRDIAYDWDGDEEREGPGDYGSYVHLSVDEVEVDEVEVAQ